MLCCVSPLLLLEHRPANLARFTMTIPPKKCDLERIFLHQNPATGEVGAARLTVRQLCRLLCPTNKAAASPLWHGGTQLLEVLPDGAYASSGWQAAGELAIFRHAMALWYREEGGGDGQSPHGPWTCRRLAESLQEEKEAASSNTLRFYSDVTGAWQLISELPELETALQAFSTTPATPAVTGETAAPAYDVITMAFPSQPDIISAVPSLPETANQQVQDDLEAFLASTDKMGPAGKQGEDKDEDKDEEAYESDGGTRYVKDLRTGNFVHEALLPKRQAEGAKENTATTKKRATEASSVGATSGSNPKKRKKSKFSARHAKCWVYITGLPADATEEEVTAFFAKVGILDLDPETQRPKVKVYRHKAGTPEAGQGKGDASVCYARPESVELALTVLDEAPFRPEKDLANRIKVERAKFEQHGDSFLDERKARVSNAQRKVAKLAAKQATDWDGGDFNGRLTGGIKGLRIIALQPIFASGVSDEELQVLEGEVRTDCESYGKVEKITFFASNPRGVVVVKFTQPGAASQAVKAWEGRLWKNLGNVQASYWDGVTDYTVRNEAKEDADMEERHKEFGDWLETQDLPEELRLKVE